MANQLETAGSQNNEKQHRLVPLAAPQIFTGYWPNSAPYRDAAVSFIYAKFYGATRNDKIAAGLNTEVSPQMTLIRRPGNPVWNSNSFTNVLNFYSFTPFVASVGEEVYVIVDTASAVYIGSVNGSPQKTLLFTKSSGAGRTTFQGEGNTLYGGDGVDIWKWSWFPLLAHSTAYPAGTTILDNNNNLQMSLGYAVGVVSTSVTSNIGTCTFNGTGTVTVGDTMTFYGLTATVALNGAAVTILTKPSGSTFTFTFVTANYSTTADTGIAVDSTTTAVPTSSSAGVVLPVVVQGVVLDGTVGWQCWGSSVQNLGIVAPTLAPTVQNTPVPVNSSWAASTYFWPNPFILDSNGSTGPWVWSLTTSGTTNSTVPTGLTTGTPTPLYSAGSTSSSPTTVTDGTAVWTCNSKASRLTSTQYLPNQVVAVSWTYTYYTYDYEFMNGRWTTTKTPHNVSYSAFFSCQVGGTTSTTATTLIKWSTSLGATTMDGGVTWVNIGYEVTRTASATKAPSGGGISNIVAGNVSNSVLVSNLTQIADSNDNGEVPVIAGLSGSTAPTWTTAQGSSTLDGTSPCLTWSNQGTLGGGNTGVWFYAYSYVNVVTGDESTASPLSAPILLAANSAITVSGPGSPDTQVGAINIYRTTQLVGASSGTPFFLTQIPAPLNGQSWQFTDTTPDPGLPGAILNIFLTASGYGVVNGVVTNYNDPPPAGLTNLSFHAGRMWGTVGNISYYSTGPDVTVGNGNTAWNALNFYETPGTQMRLWPTTVGLFVFTNDGLWLVEGLGTTSNPFQEIQLADGDVSIESYVAFCTAGTQCNVLCNDRSYLSIDPQNGKSWLGEPVATDLLATYSPTTSYVTFHSNGLDQHGFVSNGVNWLNWMSVPAPETGYLWNPPAVIAAGSGGVGAVMSIKTAPGVYQLLIGPSGTGPILTRDSTYTTFTDATSTAYSAWAAFGNIVFVHHGQLAGLVLLGADFVRIGSVPVVSWLADEVLGKSATPAWTVIPNPVNDPPNFAASNTLYQLRYWLINSQEPTYCRNALFKFDFGTDTVKNELYCFTIFGESITEEGST